MVLETEQEARLRAAPIDDPVSSVPWPLVAQHLLSYTAGINDMLLLAGFTVDDSRTTFDFLKDRQSIYNDLVTQEVSRDDLE